MFIQCYAECSSRPLLNQRDTAGIMLYTGYQHKTHQTMVKNEKIMMKFFKYFTIIT